MIYVTGGGGDVCEVLVQNVECLVCEYLYTQWKSLWRRVETMSAANLLPILIARARTHRIEPCKRPKHTRLIYSNEC